MKTRKKRTSEIIYRIVDRTGISYLEESVEGCSFWSTNIRHAQKFYTRSDAVNALKEINSYKPGCSIKKSYSSKSKAK